LFRAFVAILALASIVSAPASGDTVPLEIRLQQSLDAMHSLTGRFVQSLDSGALGRPRSEKGTFAIRKPAMMRWSYEEPEVKLAITDGRETWLYLPEDREAHRGLLDEHGAGAAAMLLAGKLKLDLDFIARELTGQDLIDAGPQGVAGAEVLELRPKKADEEFDRLLVAVDPLTNLIRRVTVVDSLGGRMIFELYDLVENKPVPDDLFRFVPPPGVQVIDER